MILLGLWLGIAWWRKRDIPTTPWFLRATAISGVAAIVALECGWIVTEVGRQPWIVYEVMRTEDAVTEADGVWISLGVVFVVYAALGAATIVVLRAMSASLAGGRRRRGSRTGRAPPRAICPRRRCEQRGRRRGRALGGGDALRGVRGRGLRRRASGRWSRGAASVASGRAR